MRRLLRIALWEFFDINLGVPSLFRPPLPCGSPRGQPFARHRDGFGGRNGAQTRSPGTEHGPASWLNAPSCGDWVFVMRLKRILHLIRPRKRRLDAWQFAFDAREVMAIRIRDAITGSLSDAEARRMVVEKHAAAVRAQLAYTRSLVKDGPAAASRAAFDVYNQAVQANRTRLRKRRRY
jgi:hypothetical protein